MKKNIRLRKSIIIILFLIFIFGFSFSLKNIIQWQNDNDKTDKIIKKIYNNIIINDDDNDSDNTSIIEPKKTIPKTNYYWDYIKMKMINVDFDNLKKMNSSTVGWIKVNGTNINYPFVQNNDNKFYLNHSFDKSYNNAGWVFLDYRNKINTLDKNTIIYAHGRFDTTMFGSLKNIFNNSWLSNPENFIIKISTEYQNTLWQVFSVYTIDTTSDYIQINFKNTTHFKIFSQMLINRSMFNFNTTINDDDKIVTLSTCYNQTKKMVLHAKLIKIEEK